MISKIFVLSILVLNSCGSQKHNNPLKTSTWEVISIQGKSDFLKTPTMLFSEKNHRVDGSSGCNNYSGEFTINGKNISFSRIKSTMMACFDDDTEHRFLSAIGNVTSYRFEDDKLQLLDKRKNVVMVLQDSKTQKGVERIVYQANSRGFYEEILLSKDQIVIHKNRNRKHSISQKISKKEWEECLQLLSNIRIHKLSTLKAPTSKRLYDGAAHAFITVQINDKTISSSTFDHGYPPKQIKALVEKVLSFKKLDEK